MQGREGVLLPPPPPADEYGRPSIVEVADVTVVLRAGEPQERRAAHLK